MTSHPDFKSCEHFDNLSGICKRAKYLPEIQQINPYSIAEYQCCFLLPPGTSLYECPNPKINPQQETTDLVSPEPNIEIKESVTTSQKVDIYEAEVLIRLINELRQDMEILVSNQKQELNRIVEPLVARIKKLEENENKRIQKISLLPNGDIPRPRPTIRVSEKAKKDLEFTNPAEAEKQFDQNVLDLEINEDILNEQFFEDILDDIEDIDET